MKKLLCLLLATVGLQASEKAVQTEASEIGTSFRLSAKSGECLALVRPAGEIGKFKIDFRNGQKSTELDSVWVTDPGEISLFNWEVKKGECCEDTFSLRGFLLSSQGHPGRVNYPSELHIVSDDGQNLAYPLDTESDIPELVQKNTQEILDTKNGLDQFVCQHFVTKKLMGFVDLKWFPYGEFPMSSFKDLFEFDSSPSEISVDGCSFADIRSDLLSLPLEGTHWTTSILLQRIRGLQIAALARVREENSWSKEGQYPVPHPRMVQLKLALDRVVGKAPIDTRCLCGCDWPAICDGDDFVSGEEQDGATDMADLLDRMNDKEELTRLQSERAVCFPRYRRLVDLAKKEQGSYSKRNIAAHAARRVQREAALKKRDTYSPFFEWNCLEADSFLDEGEDPVDMQACLDELSAVGHESSQFAQIMQKYGLLDAEEQE